ncbi:Flavodoxin-like fold subfamily protein [Oceanococcus atlanticus]|uniref:FMN dependent NADH:quinone oxidoreductase n=1 Tax=Oceanococcus atlanticus TaxID=1317117 RepID=A0A1Y1SD75_9GAMM|nr:NAD(P)H-dependent oxidoreductase [Oceanococcus atlanticus]ORE86930.1 Flavodoxin-like fold subfamily protein [Oceanococcus atlanticus]
MTTLLQINTSLFSDQGQSSQLANQFVRQWQASHPDSAVVTRDLASEPVPHLDAQRFSAFLAAPEARSAEQQAIVDYSDALIRELQQADVIVMGLPLYNFGVPSQLKAYIDHVARNGVTFRYTENGPEGLLRNKKVYVFAARGGLYAGTPLDTQSDYIRHFLAFIGIDDVEFVYAEGLNISADAKDAALNKAHDEIQRLAA